MHRLNVQEQTKKLRKYMEVCNAFFICLPSKCQIKSIIIKLRRDA